MSDEENQHIPMAECGACQAIIPLDSESCTVCGARFGGVSEETLGECGACGKLQPVDSEKCVSCGVSFIEEDIPAKEEAVPEHVEEIHDEVVETTPEVESLVDTEDERVTKDVEEDIVEVETHDEQSSEEEVLDEEQPVAETLVTEEEFVEDIVENLEEEDLTASDSLDAEDSFEEEMVEESEEDTDEETTTDTDDIENFEDDDLVHSLGEEEQDSEVEAEEETPDVEIPEEEDQNNLNYWRTTVVTAFENLALAIAESGMTASDAFVTVDGNDDKLIDAPELQKGIEKISGEWLTANQVLAIVEYLDVNDNNRVDPMELIQALDDLKIGIKPGKMPKDKSRKVFPSNVQKMLMSKTANDVIYPIAYFLMVTLVGLMVVNGMGLIVDGSGGTIVHEGPSSNWNHCGTEVGDTLEECSGYVSDGEKYPCFAEIDTNGCKNSLTIFSGEDGASSMPAGFYLDGIMLMLFGLIGLTATAFLHLIYAPSLRSRTKKESGEETPTEDSTDEDKSEEDSEEDEHDEEDSEEEHDDEDSEEEHDDEDTEEEHDDEDSEDDEDNDDIDVGDWVGLEIDGEEVFGEIVEFDDDEGTVTIETEDGDEVTGDQDDMFLEDDDEDDE